MFETFLALSVVFRIDFEKVYLESKIRVFLCLCMWGLLCGL